MTSARVRVLPCVLATAPLLVACPQPSAAPVPQVYFVAPEGSDRDPGTEQRPWASLHHAARSLGPGDQVLVRGGTYVVDSPIVPARSGTADAWIVYAAAPGEEVILDADALPTPPPSGAPPFAHDQGAIQIEGQAYLRVQGFTLRRSHRAGITIRDSHHVAIVGNTIDHTFTSGIAAWDSEHDAQGTSHIEIRGNTLTRTNTWDMLPPGWPRFREPPHEAISLGGVQHFEVADNHVHHCDKEGIDIKENSRHGRVHHNHVHHLERQGLYVDGWFDTLRDVELDHNEVHHCHGAGIVLSVENGPAVEDVRVHHNLVYDNDGTGLLFSRWGDGPRRRVVVERNTIHRNGWGEPKKGHRWFWITGGIHLLSANLEEVEIRDNLVSGNAGFQIGVSHHWQHGGNVEAALRQRRVTIQRNLVETSADAPAPVVIEGEEPEKAWVTPIAGEDAIEAAPQYVDAEAGDLRLRADSPGIVDGQALGALPNGE